MYLDEVRNSTHMRCLWHAPRFPERVRWSRIILVVVWGRSATRPAQPPAASLLTGIGYFFPFSFLLGHIIHRAGGKGGEEGKRGPLFFPFFWGPYAFFYIGDVPLPTQLTI